MNDCADFIETLLESTEPLSFPRRYTLGCSFIIREINHYRSRKQTKHLPTSGFKSELITHGQHGEIYRHLRFHIGCTLLGILGSPISILAEELDKSQARQGRKESITEIKDNEAGRASGGILIQYFKKQLSRDQAKSKLSEILMEPLA